MTQPTINDAQTVNDTITQRIRELLARSHMSVAGFADMCGISRYSVDRWLHRGQIPSGYSIYLICAAFDVSADWLLGLDRR